MLLITLLTIISFILSPIYLFLLVLWVIYIFLWILCNREKLAQLGPPRARGQHPQSNFGSKVWIVNENANDPKSLAASQRSTLSTNSAKSGKSGKRTPGLSLNLPGSVSRLSEGDTPRVLPNPMEPLRPPLPSLPPLPDMGKKKQRMPASVRDFLERQGDQ